MKKEVISPDEYTVEYNVYDIVSGSDYYRQH